MPASRAVTIVAAAVVLAGCAGQSADVAIGGDAAPATSAATTAPSSSPSVSSAPRGSGPSSSTPAPAQSLNWQSCGRFQCATLTVPLDYTDSSKGTIDLYLKRRPASDKANRVGSLLVNPGGPGVPGTSLVDQATLAFSEDLLDRFDIVSWDPRGTGQSNAVDCVDNLDPYFAIDPIPDTPAEKQAIIDAAKQFDADCEERSGRLLPYISTQDTARDMDQVRAALGEDKISYFGFSYGSQIGATYATLFPSHVRAMALDGAADPNAGYVESTKQQVVGLERGLAAMLDDCAKKTSCAFHHEGNPAAAYDALMAKLATNPIPSGEANRPLVGTGIAIYAVVSGLYVQEYWPIVTRALAAAEKGDGSALLQLYDTYIERQSDGTWTNAFEDLIAINCVDDPGPKDPSFPDSYAAELQTLSPHFGAWAAYSYNCIFWPAPQKPPLKLTGAGAGPIVVVGTTGDPITPIESTKAMAQAMEKGVLVTVDANQHTGYGTNGCVVKAVDEYLIGLKVPAAGLVCS
ncbi:MAG TPA: alpha/beta hydrolase [Acidimicrobiales bacterium]|nr:alpha/beta hydrolase [Acidimicrobiales bacterium]